MRIAVLWSHLSGFLNSCLKALVDRHDVELFVSFQNESADAPYNASEFSWIRHSYRYDPLPDGNELTGRLNQFQPDAILVASWHMNGYRHVLRQFRSRAIRILFMDNQWRGTLKQRAGALISPWYIQSLYDGVFLPGERQAVFARKLGFRESTIIRGGNSCDHPAFAAVWEERKKKDDPYPPAFIYVGRLVESKGIDVLIRSYVEYRKAHRAPFALLCCGEGKLRAELEGIEGVRVLGFVQPADLPKLFMQSSCLILPSLFEPWAIVIHEATASGMPIICTSACGAMVHLVQSGFNGYVVEPGNAGDLTRAMIRYTDLNQTERRAMGTNSYNLSLQYTPVRWADNLMSFVNEHH